MKKKTEAKRQAILKAAGEVFREMGFERASMSDIRERVGGSKATLYSYFRSKETLFFEVMNDAKTAELEAITGALDADAEDIKHELIRFGQNFLTVAYSPEAIAVRRLAIAESKNSDIGRQSFERTTRPLEKQVSEFLKKSMKRGALRTADSNIAAMHLLSLMEAELLQRVLLGVIDGVKPEAVAGAVRRAVDVFLTGYARR